MAKNKEKAGKQKKDKAFTVRTGKKSKTKAISTNLKKIKLQNRSATERANESLKDVQDTLLKSAKSSNKETTKKVQKTQERSAEPAGVPDVDMTTDSLAKL